MTALACNGSEPIGPAFQVFVRNECQHLPCTIRSCRRVVFCVSAAQQPRTISSDKYELDEVSTEVGNRGERWLGGVESVHVLSIVPGPKNTPQTGKLICKGAERLCACYLGNSAR